MLFRLWMVFLAQEKLVLSEEQREKRKIVEVVLAVMEACLQSEGYVYMSVWNKAAKIPAKA